jgi:predicted protein tyrosine phosphatase
MDDWDEWDVSCVDHNYFNTMHEIIPGLYLGDYVSASKKKNLERRNIRRVISLGSLENHTEYAWYKDVEYLFIYIDDHPLEPINKHFDECIKFIGNPSPTDSVLIHCHAGISRSATIVIAYLIKEQKMDYYEAHRVTKQQRPCINPNDGFMKQLEELSN